MEIELTESESVLRGGERFGIDDKVYACGNAHFGVGYIKSIKLYGVHFGFKAEVSGMMIDGTVWVDSRNLTKEIPLSNEEQERIQQLSEGSRQSGLY